jgi:formate dehydrogenase subunit gamma
MKNYFVVCAMVVCAVSMGVASAQNLKQGAGASPPDRAIASIAPLSDTLPATESIDILKQNQAERSRDQPGNMAPTFRIVNSGVRNYSSLPALEAGVLIQAKTQFPGQAKALSAGEAWRQYRNGPLTNIGGWLLLITLAAIVAVYILRGEIKLKAPLSGRLIERFTPGERALHWSMALSFLTLAVSGIIMLFGKYILLPVFGLTLFSWLALFCKNIHNFVGPVFTLSAILFFIRFVKDNFPDSSDVHWVVTFGGLLSKQHVNNGRFNAGEKIIFWGVVVVLGLILSASGLVLNMLFPVVEYSRANMQLANVVHLTAAMLAASAIIGHIYLGTIGMEGAYAAMRTGYVDDVWAKEHHNLWYAQVESGKIPRVRSEQGGAHAPVGKAASLNI